MHVLTPAMVHAQLRIYCVVTSTNAEANLNLAIHFKFAWSIRSLECSVGIAAQTF
jgi:hypothetical protein